jgi:hypothetical protein
VIQAAVIGAGSVGVRAHDELRQADISSVVIPAQDVTGSVFDDNTDTWTLHTTDGTCQSRILIAAEQQTFVPWIPHALRNNPFRGCAFHSRTPDPTVDPTGRRIAVVGGDAAGGRLLDQLTGRAAEVKVFGFPPRRIVPMLTRRRRRARRQSNAQLVTAMVDSVTATGVRTSDGVHHDADVLVYATGMSMQQGLFAVPPTWRDGMEPYAGVAVRGVPNCYWLTGPDHGAQLRHVRECVLLLESAQGTRIEVRHSSQQVFSERVHLRPLTWHSGAHAYDVSTATDRVEHGYAGLATLMIDDQECRVHVRLSGRVDPLDGKYHWQGTVFDPLPDAALRRTRQVMLNAGMRSTAARIIEQNPQGGHSIAGMGEPPFAFNAVETAPREP